MTNLPDLFFNWQSLAIALAIYAVTESFRRGVQSVWKAWRTSSFYTEFVLFVLPVVVGMVLGLFASSFPWPKELPTASSRAMYASVLGLFSGMVYGRAKKVLGHLLVDEPKNKA